MKKGLYASLLCVLLSILLTGCVRLTIDPSPQELMGFQEDVLAGLTKPCSGTSCESAFYPASLATRS